MSHHGLQEQLKKSIPGQAEKHVSSWSCSWRQCRACLATSAGALLCLVMAGCIQRAEKSVVVYSAADQEYASPILGAFTRHSGGIEVLPVFDVESTKTVGLVARLEAESDRPRCDVFWNNEIMHTLRLQDAGLLKPIRWNIPANWPADMRSQDGTWIGIAARARVLLVNRELVPNPEDWPRSVQGLADEKWRGKFCFAEPLAGTTATHFAILDNRLGKQAASELFQKLKNQGVVLSGNKQVAQAVSAGEVPFGLTDTDDALIEIDAGLPVEFVFPDQAKDQSGTLRIPNTLAVLQGCPHPIAAVGLANYLASEDTEGRLAMGMSGQIPIRPDHPQPARVTSGQDIRWMEADFRAAAVRWPKLATELRTLFRSQ